MKSVKRLAVVLSLALILGCWDQKLMKNERTVSIGGIDNGREGGIRYTVSIRDIIPKEASSGEASNANQILSDYARTSQQAKERINARVPGDYTASKMRVLLLGEDMVRHHDVMPYLDVYYRDSRSPLNAKIAVSKGTAEEMIRLKKIGSRTIGVFIDQLLSSSREMDILPSVNIQTLHPLDRGYDFSVPYLTVKEGMPSILGLALFSGTRMTDWLTTDESKIYLLLCGNKSNKLNLTLKTSVGRIPSASDGYGYVTFEVHKFNRKLRVFATEERIKVDLRLTLNVFVNEDPSDHLYKLPVMHDLEKQLSDALTKQAEEVVEKIQRANHDGLGIARRLMSFYPRIWRRTNWNDVYPHIGIHTNITLKIVNTGITQ